MTSVRALTPLPIIAALGKFDLDPAGAPGWVTADQVYIPENGQDGLVLPWRGRVWLNPPTDAGMKPFMKRMAEHHHGTALVPAGVETQMFQRQIFGYATAMLFIEGRIPFMRWNGLNHITRGSAIPSVLIAYGEEDALALRNADIKGHFVWMDGAKRTGERRLT